ncbi:MAG TPA: hypothetical protein VEZ70_07380 [Allosphingosinicella sp.]|nr:hypothetical protein [Allosphingosinicella sp.]
MPRIFFHLREGENILLDDEGVVMDAAAVPEKALRTARDIVAHDAREGRINLGCSLEIRDEAGVAVHTLRFEDAVEIRR